ncbi:MAG: hypothetical protein ACJA1U_001975 [Bermanella sp.]|jgi:hypothetical protein
MTSWLNAFKAMLQQLIQPQQTLQPIKIEVQDQPQRVQPQRRRRR